MFAEPSVPHCNCCPACTVLCLPLKVIRSRQDIEVTLGARVVEPYSHCHLDP